MMETLVVHERAGWRWLVKNMQRFWPADMANPETAKEIGELAILYAQSAGSLGSKEDHDIDTIGAFLNGFFSLPEVAHLARRRPGYHSAYIIPYLFLRSGGLRIADYEETLQRLSELGYPGACETMPFRSLELRYATWKAGLTADRPTCEGIYHATTMAMCQNPVYLVNWEVYSITHSLFYLTDFFGPPVGISEPDRQRFGDMLEALMVHYWRRANWDLTGELLINLLSLDFARRPSFVRCAQALFEAWRADGTLPGPSFDPHAAQIDDDYIFHNSYHTTLVGLIFCRGYREFLASSEEAIP
jgi:hypothetical protein